MTHRPLMVIIMLSAWIPVLPAAAQAPAAYVTGALSSAVAGAGALPAVPALLEFTLADGWYMYWRTPGDSGLAPSYDWSASVNVGQVAIDWPAPQRFEQDGMYSFGYSRAAAFPLTVTPAEAGKPVRLALEAALIVCNKICVPQNLSLTLDIPAGPAVADAAAARRDRALAAVPRKGGGGDDFRLDTAVLGKGSVIFTLYSRDGFAGTDLFVESDALALTAPPQVEPDAANPQAAIFRIEAPPGSGDLTAQLLGKTVTVTAVKDGKAVEKDFSF